MRPASVANIKSAWDHFKDDFGAEFQTSQDGITAGTVFRADWNGASWDPIVTFFSEADLGLHPGDDIDALAYYYVNEDDKIVFSLTPNPGRDGTTPEKWQLRIGGGGTSYELFAAAAANARIAKPIGFPNVANIDSVCGWDPDGVRSRWCASPGDEPASPLALLGASVQSYPGPLGERRVRMMATGLPVDAGVVTYCLALGNAVTSWNVAHSGNPVSQLDVELISLGPSRSNVLEIKAQFTKLSRDPMVPPTLVGESWHVYLKR